MTRKTKNESKKNRLFSQKKRDRRLGRLIAFPFRLWMMYFTYCVTTSKFANIVLKQLVVAFFPFISTRWCIIRIYCSYLFVWQQQVDQPKTKLYNRAYFLARYLFGGSMMHISIPYSIIIIKHIVILLVANVASVPLEYCKTQTKTNRYRPCSVWKTDIY